MRRKKEIFHQIYANLSAKENSLTFAKRRRFFHGLSLEWVTMSFICADCRQKWWTFKCEASEKSFHICRAVSDRNDKTIILKVRQLREQIETLIFFLKFKNAELIVQKKNRRRHRRIKIWVFNVASSWGSWMNSNPFCLRLVHFSRFPFIPTFSFC